MASAATWSHASSVARPATKGQSPAPDAWVARLSTGAPAGAQTLTAEPVMVTNPVAATPALVSALAANGIPQDGNADGTATPLDINDATLGRRTTCASPEAI